MTEKQMKKNAINNYRFWCKSDKGIYDAYSRPSIYKTRAYALIEDEMKKLRGYGLAVISHNSQMFTCGYLFKDENGERMFCYHTKNYRVVVPVSACNA